MVVIKLLCESIVAVRQGSGKEMPQLVGSYETCVELRATRFDETAILTGAREFSQENKPHSQMLTRTVCLRAKFDRRWPMPDLLFLLMKSHGRFILNI